MLLLATVPIFILFSVEVSSIGSERALRERRRASRPIPPEKYDRSSAQLLTSRPIQLQRLPSKERIKKGKNYNRLSLNIQMLSIIVQLLADQFRQRLPSQTAVKAQMRVPASRTEILKQVTTGTMPTLATPSKKPIEKVTQLQMRR